MQPVKEHIHIYAYMPPTLRYTGLVGAGLLAIGLFLLHLHPDGRTAVPMSTLLAALCHLDAVAWLQAGILVLLATPIIGLLSALVGAILDADWRLLANCVLLLLLLWITVVLK